MFYLQVKEFNFLISKLGKNVFNINLIQFWKRSATKLSNYWQISHVVYVLYKTLMIRRLGEDEIQVVADSFLIKNQVISLSFDTYIYIV